jgi:hypothetical protein
MYRTNDWFRDWYVKYIISFDSRIEVFQERQYIKLDDDFWEQEEKVTEEERSSLEAEIYEEEVNKAIDSSNAEGGSGLDGFSFMFYQKMLACNQERLYGYD